MQPPQHPSPGDGGALGLYLHLEVARAGGSLQRGRRGAVQQLHWVIHCREQRERGWGQGHPAGLGQCRGTPLTWFAGDGLDGQR